MATHKIKTINDVVSGGGGGGGSANTFVKALSWSVGPTEATMTILQGEHEKGLDPQVQIFETIVGDIDKEVDIGSIEVNSSGDVTLKIPSASTFNGKVVII